MLSTDTLAAPCHIPSLSLAVSHVPGSLSAQVLSYLDERPCAEQSRESILNFVEELQKLSSAGNFELTDAEILQLVSNQPRSLVEIHLIVEECEERLTQEQVQTLLKLCYTLTEEDESDAGAS
jgi:DNA-directed RNA polymerase subunit F